MNNDPRHIQGGCSRAEGVDQQKKSTTPPPNEQERANGAAHAEVCAHVQMLHRLAEPLRGRGKLIIASYGQDPITGQHIPPKVLHCEIGDMDRMAEQIELLSREQHRNVCIPLAVFDSNRPLGKKGGEARKEELGPEGYSQLGQKGGQRVKELIEEGRAAQHRPEQGNNGEPPSMPERVGSGTVPPSTQQPGPREPQPA